MSSWSRTSYRTDKDTKNDRLLEIREDQGNGWQTVGAPRAARTWGGGSENSRWASSGGGSRAWGGGAPRSEMPSAFSKKPREDDRPPRRTTDEEARREYMMKLAAEKARAEAEQAKQIADTEDNFPSLGAPKRTTAAQSAPPSKSHAKLAQSQPPGLTQKSWAAQIKTANDENEQKRLADEQAAKEAADKLAEGMTVLRLGRKEMREPFFTTGQIETEADFAQNERLRRACFSSTIMEEQEKYDYNREVSYREEDFDDEPVRVYSPHSPKYPHSFDYEETLEEE